MFQNLHQIFQNVDQDRSGKVNAGELQKALSNGTFLPFNPETCKLMIGKICLAFSKFYSILYLKKS